MKLAIAGAAGIREQLQSRFREFNKQSVRSRGRRYPADLQALVNDAYGLGISHSELKKLTDMSDAAVRYATGAGPRKSGKRAPPKPAARPKAALTVRRLEVRDQPASVGTGTGKLVIRLGSGATIETDANTLLSSGLLAALGGIHAATR